MRVGAGEHGKDGRKGVGLTGRLQWGGVGRRKENRRVEKKHEHVGGVRAS